VILDGNFATYDKQIFNSVGQLVEDLSNHSSPMKIKLDNLSPGLHFIIAKDLSNQNLYVHKILKQ